MTRVGTRLRADRGVASVEVIGIVPYMVIAALAVWQLLLSAATVTAAENAARTGSRTASRGGDATTEAIAALPQWLRDDAEAERGDAPGCADDEPDSGTRVVVCIKVPIVMPGVSVDALTVRRDAWLPRTD